MTSKDQTKSVTRIDRIYLSWERPFTSYIQASVSFELVHNKLPIMLNDELVLTHEGGRAQAMPDYAPVHRKMSPLPRDSVHNHGGISPRTNRGDR